MFPYPSGAGLHVGHPEGYTATDILAATSGCAASTCCTRWAGTPSACPPSSTPSRPARTRATTTQQQHRHLPPADQDARLQLRLGPRGRHHRSRATSSGRSGSSCSCSSAVWRTRPRCRSTGARRSAPCWPTRRSSTARASAAAIPSSACRCGSGCCGSPPTPSGCSRTSTLVDWPEATMTMQRNWIGRARAPRSTSRVDGHAGRAHRRLHHAARHAVRRDVHGARARAPLVAHAHDAGAARRRRRVRRGGARARATCERTDAGQDEDRRLHRRRTRSTRSTASRSRSGSPTTCSAATAPARSWPCPAHDERDFEFATHVRPADRRGREPGRRDCTTPLEAAYVDDGVAVRSGEFDGLPTRRGASAQIIAELEALGRGAAARSTTSCATGSSRASATGASRSRSTSRSSRDPTAIRAKGARTRSATTSRSRSTSPSCRCACPSSTTSSPASDPAGPLARVADWRFFQRDGRWYARETNTMPQWAGSCWYYLRFLDPQNDDRAVVARTRRRTGCRSTSTSAAPSTRCCTCSTRASGTRCSSTAATSSTPSRSRSS